MFFEASTLVTHLDHAIIYAGNCSGDVFPLGYSCALSVVGGVADGEELFDFFEPVDCSEVELRLGVFSEIELVGFDWF